MKKIIEDGKTVGVKFSKKERYVVWFLTFGFILYSFWPNTGTTIGMRICFVVSVLFAFRYYFVIYFDDDKEEV